MVSANLKVGNMIKPKNCYFPSEWTDVQVRELINFVLENPTNVDLVLHKTTLLPFKLIVKGACNGTEIRVFLQNNNTLITAFPRIRIP